MFSIKISNTRMTHHVHIRVNLLLTKQYIFSHQKDFNEINTFTLYISYNL